MAYVRQSVVLSCIEWLCNNSETSANVWQVLEVMVRCRACNSFDYPMLSFAILSQLVASQALEFNHHLNIFWNKNVFEWKWVAKQAVLSGIHCIHAINTVFCSRVHPKLVLTSQPSAPIDEAKHHVLLGDLVPQLLLIVYQKWDKAIEGIA
ncbi:unnamed protein product [Oppiella nova]|uniref:Uncharacterized protein n=1 Tax=Oppiella nova TaxID=334625 RepID=A0A7R9M6D2_9ACAR|nr:unnamed protein product [Oppiella nova]CAG2171599.1 unnamed protein product [Oppiella nova]